VAPAANDFIPAAVLSLREYFMGRIMWSQVEGLYRGQALTGTVITIDDDALKTALKNAGESIFDTEWWMETLNVVLERWGLKSKHWTDPATQVLRIHFRMANTDQQGANGDTKAGTGPLTTRLMSTGKLNPSSVGTGGLNSNKLDSGKLGDRK
jgi:hypothetical protein